MMRKSKPIRPARHSRAAWSLAALACSAVLLMVTGCGVLTATRGDLRAGETIDDGSFLDLDEIRDIVDDPDLSDDEKRDALRALGIEDEDLIDALLGL